MISWGEGPPSTFNAYWDNTVKESKLDKNGNVVTTTTTTTIIANKDGSVDQTTQTNVEVTDLSQGVANSTTSTVSTSTTTQNHASAAAFANANGVAVKTGSGGADLSNISAASLASVVVVNTAAQDMGLPKPVITSGRDGKHRSGSLHYEMPSRALDYRGNNVTDQQLRDFAALVGTYLGTDYDAVAEFFQADPNKDHLHVEHDP